MKWPQSSTITPEVINHVRANAARACEWIAGSYWGDRDPIDGARCVDSDYFEGDDSGTGNRAKNRLAVEAINRTIWKFPGIRAASDAAEAAQNAHVAEQIREREQRAAENATAIGAVEALGDMTEEEVRSLPHYRWNSGDDNRPRVCANSAAMLERYEMGGDSRRGHSWWVSNGIAVSASLLTAEHLPIIAAMQAARDAAAAAKAEEAARIEAERIAAIESDRVERLRLAGLRDAEIVAARESAEAEKRIRDIAAVRKNWREWSGWSRHCRRLSDLHPEAIAMMDRVVRAQAAAETRRAQREARERAADDRHRTAAEKASAESDERRMFGLGNAFAGLNF